MSNFVPEVSVIIPCYNGSRFIAEAIESVMAQTLDVAEVIVVDDGSTDDSVAVVERFTGTERVTLLRHKSNRGIPAARNTGVRSARGRFIGFLDQDDLYREDKLEKQLEAFGHGSSGELGVVLTNAAVLDTVTGEKRFPVSKAPKNMERLAAAELLSHLLVDTFVTTGSALIRKECLDATGPLDERIRGGTDDFDLFVRLARTYRFAHIDEAMIVRRTHGSNYTNLELMVPETLVIIDRVVAELPALARIVPRAKSRLMFRLGRDLHTKGERRRACRAYKESLRYRSTNVRSLIALLLCSSGAMGDAILSALVRVRKSMRGR
ncbi:MAG: glycosyltransferase family 2 protein [Candidatus Krumholzibacteriota bacterium]|nr:glycosyltransferase family 2 protein [Candidatus Krumholzibacteriota bacterium]